MTTDRRTTTAPPTWHAILAEVEPAGSLVMKKGPLAGRQPPHACRVVQSLAAALKNRPQQIADGTPAPPTWLIAPSRRIGHQWVETLARVGCPVVNLQVTTVSALAFNVIAGDLAGESCRVASRQAKQSIIERLLNAHSGSLELFTRSGVSAARLAKLVLNSIEALQMAGLSPDDVCKALHDQPKGRDLRILMRAYEEELVTLSLIDKAGQVIRATEAVKQGRIPPNVRRILVPDDLDLTKLERDMLEAFGKATDVTLEDLATDPPLSDQPSTAERDHEGSPEVPGEAAWGAEFFQAIGESNEVRGVLRKCLANELRFDEVEIIHTDSSTYPSLIREIVAALPRQEDFEDPDDTRRRTGAPLPVTIAEGLSVRDSKPGRALLAWMQWCRDGHPQGGLERMVREGLLQVQSKEHAVSASMIVKTMRQLRFGHGLERLASLASEKLQLLSELTFERYLAERGNDDNADEVLTQVEFEQNQQHDLAALKSIIALTGKLRACDPFLRKSDGEDSPLLELNCAHHFVEQLCQGNSEFDGNAKNVLVEAIADAILWQGDLISDNTTWLEQLPSALVVMGAGPRPGCLHISHIGSGGHSGRPYTFIIGLDEDRFPGSATDDPVLTDQDRMRLNQAHPDSDLAEGAAAARRKMDSWWRLLARLGGQIFLGFSCRDTDEGAEMFPSPAVLTLYGRIHKSPSVKASQFMRKLGAPEAFVPSVASLALDESQARLAIIGPKASKSLRSIATRAHRPYLPYGQDAEEHRQSEHFTPYDGKVPAAGPLLDPCAIEGREASPHSLETLGACPRRFFFRYGLDIKPYEPPLDDCDRWLSAKETGTVLHVVLEKFVGRLIERGATPSADAAQKAELLEILEAELTTWRQRTPPLNDIAFGSTRGELEDAVLTFLKDESERYSATNMRPIAIEVAIGLTASETGTPFDSPDPVAIELTADKQIKLRGRIDRVDYLISDEDDEGSRTYSLWDYKSGSAYSFPKPSDTDPFDQGRKLQHGLYILMLAARIDEAPDDATTGRVDRFGYFFPSRRGKGCRLEWSASQLSRCAELVAQLTEIVREGAFLPTTHEKDCDYCNFIPVCGDSSLVVKQARQKFAASKELNELFKTLNHDPQPRNPLKRYPKNELPLSLTPHTQGPKPPPDEEARKRIREDLDTNLLVEASAGTGKTTCIVDRLFALILSGKVKPHELVAVTFTRKAAGELRRRFREALHDASVGDVTPEQLPRLQEAIAHADSMVVGTIHSFAAKLLRDRAVEAGVDPGFIELEENADHVLRERAWRAFTDNASSRHAAIVQALEDVGLRLGDLHFAFVNQFADYGDIDNWPAPPTPPPNVEDVLKELTPFITKIREETFPSAMDRGTDELMTDLEQLVSMYDRADRESVVAVMQLVESLDREPKLVKKHWPGGSAPDKKTKKAAHAAADSWKSAWDQVRTNSSPFLWQWRAHRYPKVIEALTAARCEYDRLRHDAGALSFQDLLSKTVDLLKSSRTAREDFRDRYPHILVDEFQDTDPIQAELVLLLCSTDPAEGDALKCVPRPGSLFVVGDPKQSLYRFRRADIVTYTRVKEILERHGAVVELTTTFRSRSDLVDFINGVFQAEFPAIANEYSPAFETATSGRIDAALPTHEPHSQWLCGVWALRYARSGYQASEWVIDEARTIAEFISAAIKGKYLVPRTEDELAKGASFECSARDFLIVARERAHLSIYAAALQAAGISVDGSGALGSDYAESLRTLRNCLAAIADRADPVAKLALLRGPVFGMSDDDLLAYKQQNGSFYGNIDAPTGCGPHLQPRLADASAAFQRWHRWARNLPVTAAVERIIDDAGLLMLASSQGDSGPSGRAAAGLVQLFVEKLRRNRETVLTINDCLDLMDDLLATENKSPFDPLAIDSESDDHVRLMNLHKAKGLEAPVVFLCDYQMRDAATTPANGPTLYVDRKINPAAGWLSVMRRSGRNKQLIAAPHDWPRLCDEEIAFESAERIRADYVAATRPGTALVVSQFGKVDPAKKRPPQPETFTAKGAWERFGTHLESIPELPSDGIPREPDQADEKEALHNAAIESTVFRKKICLHISALAEPTFARISPREVLTESAEGLKYSGKGRGEDWGQVIHTLLEHVARLPECDVERLARAALTAEELPLTYLSDAKNLIDEIIASDLWRESQESPHHFSEVPFSIQVEGNSLSGEARDNAGLQGPPLPTVIRGVIDRIFQDHDGKWHVIDWKTDAVTEASRGKLEEHYRPQVNLYAECWRLIQDDEQQGASAKL